MDNLLNQLGMLLDVHLMDVSGTEITVATALTAVLIVIGAMWMSRLARRGAEQVLRQRQMASEGGMATLLSLLHYLIIAVGITVALQTLGIDLATLFAAGAVFAVGLGFAMQNIAQNFVAGIILLAERSIRPGDVLEVEGTIVRVEETKIRATLVRSRDGEDLIIPNSILVQSTVRNFTLQDSVYRITTSVGVAYTSDMSEVRQVLERTADQLDWRLDEPEPQVFMREFGNSAVVFEVAVWVHEPWRARRLQSQLNQAIWDSLQSAGITIAFPQVDVHLSERVELSG